jgi:CBS domain-containing protein
VDQWLNPAVLTMPASMPVHRAAAQAVATRTRHIVVMELEGIGGIVTAADFMNVKED